MAEQGSVMPKADYGRRPTTRRRCGTFADVAQKMAAMQKWIAEYRAVVRADEFADLRAETFAVRRRKGRNGSLIQ
jgi:hypothetical protein